MRNAYWDYVYAIQAVEVAQQSLDLAEQLVQDNQTRVEVGTMAPIDVVQAQSQAATPRQTLASAQATVRTTELALKRLIVERHGGSELERAPRSDRSARLPPRSRSTSRRPCAARSASAPTWRSPRRTSQANDVTLKYLNDQTLPQADLVGDLRADRPRRRPVHHRRAPASTGVVIGTIPGGYGDALSTLFGDELPALDRRR